MLMKHTQGPWNPIIISGVCASVGATIDGGYSEIIVDMILPDTDAEYEAQKSTIEANAKLIAAAPDLLEALYKAKAIMERDEVGGYTEERVFLGSTYETVIAAIKKATE